MVEPRCRWFSLVNIACRVVACVLAGAMVSPATAEPPRLEPLEDGLAVGTTAPAGWSHLVVKSLPRLESGEVNSLPRFAREVATRFRTVIVLDVRPARGEGEGFRLERVGLGLCVPLDSGDVVLRPDTRRARESLTLVDRQVLDEATRELSQGRLIVGRPTFALLRAPSMQRGGGIHREVDVYYGFLVDPDSGRVQTLVWSRDRAEARPETLGEVRVLREDLVYDCGLDVAARRILGTVPVSWSFAMNDLPPGKAIRLSSSERMWFERPDRIVADPETFERWVRERLGRPRKADRSSPPGRRTVLKGSESSDGGGASRRNDPGR